MKFLFISILFFSSNLFSQEIENLEQNVVGMINSNGEIYLVLENGFLKLENDEAYIEYYRKIYNDSTITNPNTEIKENYSLNFFPYLIPTQNDFKIDFDQPMKLGILIELKSSEKFNLSDYGKTVVDSIKNKSK
ncbi:MAG: hypothetical protein IPM32_11740 [Ignavibacteriae bacterium]|nr:hypothetical protein [Ignavibacteriota bacterium]